MNSIVIQERTCPRCGIRRTIRFGQQAASFCFNCRLQWGGPDNQAEEEDHPFTAEERARLLIYRSAVRRGFYSDHPGAPRTTP
jgi:hypothetical protein